MQVISLRESSRGPGGEYLLIEWRGVPDEYLSEAQEMRSIIYYLSTKSLQCSKIKRVEVSKLYKFLRRKEDKVLLMLASKFML